MKRYAHAFTGNGFVASGKAAYSVLRRNAVGGYVNDRAGAPVVFVISKVLAILLGMAAWAWFDALADLDAARHRPKPRLAYPRRALLLRVALPGASRRLHNHHHLQVPVVSYGGAVVVPVAISFFGSLVLDSMCTVLMAYAVQADGGVKNADGGDGRRTCTSNSTKTWSTSTKTWSRLCCPRLPSPLLDPYCMYDLSPRVHHPQLLLSRPHAATAATLRNSGLRVALRRSRKPTRRRGWLRLGLEPTRRGARSSRAPRRRHCCCCPPPPPPPPPPPRPYTPSCAPPSPWSGSPWSL
jgi:hypothetical protein